MKTLFLIRHAKSSRGYLGMDDHNRPLNRRGYGAAVAMGQRMRKWDTVPELFISSSAVRAWSTIELMADELGIRPTAAKIEPRIYEADVQTLLGLVQQLDNSIANVGLIGHNPGFTNFANMLANCDIDNIPTAGIVVIQVEVEAWATVAPGAGSLVLFDFPKNQPHT